MKAIGALLSLLLAAPLRAEPAQTQRFDRLIAKHSKRYGLDPRLVKSIIAAESQFLPKARSPAGARGLMQVMPKTARWLGFSPRGLDDPEANIRCGTAYLDYLYRAVWKKHGLKGKAYRDAPPWARRKVIASYHGGPRYVANGPWRPSTGIYVRRVLKFYRSPVSAVGRP